MSEEELYLKGYLLSYCHDFGYVSGIVPSDLTSKTQLKRLIQTRWIVDYKAKEKRKKIFGKLALECRLPISFSLGIYNIFAPLFRYNKE